MKPTAPPYALSRKGSTTPPNAEQPNTSDAITKNFVYVKAAEGAA